MLSRDLLRGRPADELHPGPRRDAGRRHRGHGAPVRAGDRRLLAHLDARAVAAAGMAGRGDPRGHHAEAVAVRGHRRDRRRDDHQHPRGAGQRPQLGLPLLLAARRLLRGARAQQPLRSGDDGGVPALAERTWWCARAAATSSRCTASARKRSCPSPSSTTCPATAAWGRCAWATRRRSTSSTTCTATSCSARRRPSTTIACCKRAGRAEFAHLEAVGEQAFTRLRPARRRHVGAAHARAHPHLVGADELGRLRPAGEDRRDAGPAGPHPLLARARRHHPRAHPAANRGARSARPSPKASAAATSMPACC